MKIRSYCFYTGALDDDMSFCKQASIFPGVWWVLKSSVVDGIHRTSLRSTSFSLSGEHMCHEASDERRLHLGLYKNMLHLIDIFSLYFKGQQ